jgi:hemoglobin
MWFGKDEPSKAHSSYELLGGEEGIKRLSNRFYDYMETLPEAKEVRAMHKADMQMMREKLFMFLSGWLGGPSLYIEKYGHPKLRARHLPFPIDTKMRNQWMLCMDKALSEFDIDDKLRNDLLAAFLQTADFMRNKED